MKVLKGVIEEIRSLEKNDRVRLQDLVWKLICYSPKMPVRHHQQALFDLAVKEDISVYDAFFSQSELKFKTFKWGNGPVKVLLTHGWGSKALDFSELIHVLLQNDQLEIRAFDAPGNGSSEGELSNLLLFADAVKQVQGTFGEADVFIGHSLGGMANAWAISESGSSPQLLVSIAPLVNLKENFRTTMSATAIDEEAQGEFFRNFEERFLVPADRFVLHDLYPERGRFQHLLFYEKNDPISPAVYIESFLDAYPEIRSHQFEDTSHAKIIVDQRVISAIDLLIRSKY